MKKKILISILFIIGVILSGIASAYATNYLYNSNEVYYDNTNSNITSSDVQGAIDELYTEATNYSNINTRLTTLEGYWPNSYNGRYLSMTHSGNSQRGFIIKDASDITRSLFYYSPAADETILRSDNSSGSIGSGSLNLLGNPVTINGIDVSSVSTASSTGNDGITANFYKIGHVVTLNINSKTTASLSNSSTSSGYDTGISIPQGYRPYANVVQTPNISTTHIGTCSVRANGTIIFSNTRKISDGTVSDVELGIWVRMTLTYVTAD